MKATPEMIAAAWGAWHSRHGGKLGPGPAFVEAIEAALAAARPGEAEPLDAALIGVSSTVEEDGNWWKPCSGCYDTEDGHPTQKYGHSHTLKTDVGCGCHECGGLGAVWEYYSEDDLAAMQEEFLPHPDDLAVDRFAEAMKAKLAKKRAEGRSGWEDKDQCSREHLSKLLREHVEKGDPLDIMNFSMMLHQRGETVAPASAVEPVTWLPAEEAPRGVRALIRHRSGLVDVVYKTNNGEPFLETWRYAGTARGGEQAPWPESYVPLASLSIVT